VKTKKQQIQEIEQLLNFDGGFLSKLSKQDLQSLTQAIVNKDHVSTVEAQPPQYIWGVVITECGEFKSSCGRSRGVSIQVSKATTIPSLALVYWRMRKMNIIGLLGSETYTHSNGKGEINFYDVTHYGIDGLANSDPDFWCEMQVSGFGDGIFYWLPNLPPELQVRACRAIQEEHSVGSVELDRLFPPFLTSWQAMKALQNPEYQNFQKIISSIDEIYSMFYGVEDDSFVETIDMIITQMSQRDPSCTMMSVEDIMDEFAYEEEEAKYLMECLLDIQAVCSS